MTYKIIKETNVEVEGKGVCISKNSNEPNYIVYSGYYSEKELLELKNLIDFIIKEAECNQ